MNVVNESHAIQDAHELAAGRTNSAVRRAVLFWATWLALVACFAAMRGIYFAWNRDLFLAIPPFEVLHALAMGLRFDASAAGFVCAPLLPIALLHLATRKSRWRWNVYVGLLLALTFPLLVFGTVDAELVRAVGRRTSVDGVFLYGESNWHAMDIARQFPWLTAAGALLATLWVYAVLQGRRWIIDTEARTGYPPERFGRAAIWSVCLLVLSAGALTVAIRGGVTNTKPLALVHTHPEPRLDNLVLNTPFVLIKSLGRDPLRRLNHFESRSAMVSLLNGAGAGISVLPKAGTAGRSPNVVVLVMESLSLGYMGEVNAVAGYTPFLDSLSRQGLFFRNAWATGLRSIEGIPAVVGSVPALGKEPLLASPYASTQIDGLGSVLAQEGYETAFFHAANRGTMYFDQLSARAGFSRYFAREDYPDPADYDGAWGIFDEPYFQYVARQLGRMREPFGAVVFSLSAHHPFRVPAAVAGRLPDGPLPILKAVAYADHALRRFFETAERQPWYRDTVFIITADHGFLPYLPQYQNDLGRWRIPLIVFQPGRQWPTVDTNQPVSQIDIVPTIADLVGASPAERNWLARSVFTPGDRTVVVRAENSVFAVDRDFFLFYPLNGGAPRLYRIDDPARKNPVTSEEALRQRLVKRTEAALQYFNNGLLDGTLVQAPPD